MPDRYDPVLWKLVLASRSWRKRLVSKLCDCRNQEQRNAARERKSCTVQAIGADAVFNAVKAIAIAREYLKDKDDGVDLYITVGFTKVRFEGRDEDTTAVKYTCYLYEGSLTIYH